MVQKIYITGLNTKTRSDVRDACRKAGMDKIADVLDIAYERRFDLTDDDELEATADPKALYIAINKYFDERCERQKKSTLANRAQMREKGFRGLSERNGCSAEEADAEIVKLDLDVQNHERQKAIDSVYVVKEDGQRIGLKWYVTGETPPEPKTREKKPKPEIPPLSDIEKMALARLSDKTDVETMGNDGTLDKSIIDIFYPPTGTAGIIRGEIAGETKYCRIPIRWRPVPITADDFQDILGMVLDNGLKNADLYKMVASLRGIPNGWKAAGKIATFLEFMEFMDIQIVEEEQRK